MTTTKEAAVATRPLSLLGIRLVLWEVMFVVGGAAIGATIGGAIYGTLTTLGAISGMIAGPTVARIITRQR